MRRQFPNVHWISIYAGEENLRSKNCEVFKMSERKTFVDVVSGLLIGHSCLVRAEKYIEVFV